MANAILTPTAVTREALRILHQKCNFIGSINRQYDDQYAKDGAKIGSDLKIRLPNQYTARTGAQIQAQDTTETSTTLTVATQKGVDMQFSSSDLTMSLDRFSERIIEPAVNVLAAAMEADALSMRKDIYQQANNTAAAITSAKILEAGRKLSDSLCPMDPRNALLNTNDMANSVEALKTLFNSPAEIGKQYREGQMGKALGFDFAQNTQLNTQAVGARAGYVTNAANQTGSSLTVGTGTGSIELGEVFTIDGVFSVHPETKVSTGILQQFVVTTAYAGTTTTITFAPAIVATGATQNVSNAAATAKAVTFAGTASTAYGQSLFYHKDAFTFATADLVMPKGVDMAAREVLDGISMRLVRAYDINSDNFPVRLDVYYGYKTIRAQLACRGANLAPA